MLTAVSQSHTNTCHLVSSFNATAKQALKGLIWGSTSSEELVESHIMPLKGRLAVALKEEAMTGICGRLSALPHFNTVLAYICNSVIKSRKPIKGFV